jgi:PAS domain S-box-containing protein
LTGQTPESALGFGWLRAVHHDDHDRTEQFFKKAHRECSAFRLEYRLRRRDGGYRWVIDAATPRISGSGEFLGYIGSVIDISERKEIELTLRASEALLRIAQETGGVASFEYTVGSDDVAWSPHLYTMLGYDPITFKSSRQAFFARVHPADLPALLEHAKRNESGHIEPIEFRLVRPDGDIRWVLRRVGLFDGGRRIIGVFVDITERKRAEESNALLAAVVNSSRDAIISTGTDYRIRTWNEGAERLYGYAAAEAVGRPLSLLAPDHLRDELADFAQRVLEGEQVYAESARRHRDGTAIDVGISGAPIRAADGRVVGISAIHRDISERKKYEEHLRFTLRELSHRSKNLLAVIQAMARQTAGQSRNFAEFDARFSGRLHALAQSHDLLISHDWQGARIGDLVRAQLAAFTDPDGPRLTLTGPPVWLKPEAMQYLGLALHELATNATKHGALSAAGGSVTIEWTHDPPGDPRAPLRITWREQGGPKVRRPARKGFGHVVLERMAATLDVDVSFRFEPAGVVWSILVPSRQIAEGRGAPPSEAWPP